MKKILIYLALLFLCCSLAACNGYTKASPLGDSNAPQNDNAEDNRLETIDNHTNQAVPYQIIFDSIEDIDTFSARANGTAEQYQVFAEEKSINTLITHDIAKTIAYHVKAIDIPSLKAGFEAEDFSAIYYADRNELDIIYKVAGIRYRFVYKYNAINAEPPSPTVVAANKMLGTEAINLYQGTDCLVGYISNDNAVLQVIIYTDSVEQVELDIFKFNLSNGVSN